MAASWLSPLTSNLHFVHTSIIAPCSHYSLTLVQVYWRRGAKSISPFSDFPKGLAALYLLLLARSNCGPLPLDTMNSLTVMPNLAIHPDRFQIQLHRVWWEG